MNVTPNRVAMELKQALDRWLVDSGATHHFCSQRDWYETYTPLQIPVQAAETSLNATGYGTIQLKLKDRVITLQDVIYIPQLEFNVISTERIKKDNALGYRNHDPHGLFDIRTDRLIEAITVKSGLPTIGGEALVSKFGIGLHYAEARPKGITMDLAHRRLGHFSETYIRQLANGLATGLTLTTKRLAKKCAHCMMGQAKVQPFPDNITLTRSSRPFETIHMDLLEAPVFALGTDFKYLWCVTDDWSRMVWCIGLKDKDIHQAWKVWKAFVKRQYGDKIPIDIKTIRLDNGGEFQLTELVKEWELDGIDLQPCIAYSHHQNGVAERVFQDVVNHAISVLHEANLPTELWYEVSRSIVRIKNVMPHSFIGTTPYEAIWGRPPDVSYLRVIGSESWVLVPKKLREHKFQPRAVKCQLVGYEGSNQYVLWDPDRNEIVWARDLTIDEYQTQYTEEIQEFANDQVGILVSYDNRAYDHSAPSQGEIYEDLPPVDSDRRVNYDTFEVSEPQNTTPSAPDTIDINQLVDQVAGIEPEERRYTDSSDETFEPENLTQIPVREPYPKRTWKPSRKVRENQIFESELPALNTLTTDTIEGHPIPTGKPIDPKDMFEAMRSPDWPKWTIAMDKEHQGLLENNTWEVVSPNDIPTGQEIISCKWVFHVKTDGSFKCRWVARGFEQVEGWDYQETYAAVARADSYRLITAVAVICNWIIENVDIKTAFLNGNIDCDVYIELPDGKIGKLRKSLYGLKQAPKIWYDTLNAVLTAMGFITLPTDASVYMQSSTHHLNGTIYVAPDLILSVHVDDIHAAGRNQETINAFKTELQKHFQIVELGPIKNFLGLQFESTCMEAGQRMLTIHQERYIEELLVRFGMKECKPRASPLDSHIKLEIDRTMPASPKLLREYREMIGSLTHCMQGTRPDLAFSVSLLSRALANPSEEHVRHVKHIMRYLRGTTNHGLVYKSNEHGKFDLHAYTDADFAGGAISDGKSTSGYVFFLAGGPISWQSKRQSVVAISTTEAEYIGQANTVKHAVYLCQFMHALRLPVELPIPIYADNQGAKTVAEVVKFRVRTKHIAVPYHYQRQAIEDGTVKLIYKSTEDMTADGLTKPLNGQQFRKFKRLLGMSGD